MTVPTSGKPLVCMVALRKAALPDMSAVVQLLKQQFPEATDLGEATQGPESAVFRWGPGAVAIALKPDPIPWDDVEDACQAAWWWEGAAGKLQASKAHLLVTLAPSSEDPVDRHLRLTRVVAAVLAQGMAEGVYWPAGNVVLEPAAFQEQAAGLSRENLNPAIWIDMRISPSDDQSWSLFTTGMSAFGRPEIEIAATRHEPAEVYELCSETIGYLLASGEEVAEGGVISRSDDEQIQVHYGPSMFDDEVEVMQLEF